MRRCRVGLRRAWALLAMLLVFGLTGGSAAGQTIFVDPNATGTGTGNSWLNAITDLRPALLGAVAGNKLWVAKGTFSPGMLQSDTFTMISGVDVLGGFNGGPNGETLLSQRPDPPIGTILSGELDGLPGATPGDCMHVVTFPPNSNTIRLDGFAIRHGFADGGGPNSNGGGILMDGTGGFISDVVINQCKIRDNHADADGGGMYARHAAFGMLFCLFRKNDVMLDGGGMALVNTGEVNVFSTLFRNGRANDGGGVAVRDADIGPFFYSCEFRENRAIRGGAVFVDSQGVGGKYGNCTVVANEALENPAAVPPVAGTGGGFYVDMSGGIGMDIYNSIVWFNVKFTAGLSSPGSSIEGPDAGGVRVNYSDIEISLIAVPPPPPPLIPWPGTGNILADPLFVSLSTNNFNLQSTSPCLDAGHDPDNPIPGFPGIPPDVLDLDDNPASTITPFDLVKGNRRETDDPATDTGVDGGAVMPGINDMGAHER